MSGITVRGLDDRLIGRLRVRAAQHGRSTHEEAVSSGVDAAQRRAMSAAG